MTSTSIAELEKQEIRKRDYKQLLTKYKNAEEANDFFKLQLQDLNAKLKLEHKDKERLRQELQKARGEITNKANGHNVSHDDIEEVNNRLKEAYKKLEEEFELREQLSKDLEYTKTMLLAEERTRMLLENRNSVLEQELKNLDLKAGDNNIQNQLEETKKRLEEEMKTRQKLQEAKEALEGELEDLTKSLFEEANTMVSKEAREKFELLQAKKRLEQELEMAKSKILLDEKLLTTMKTKFTNLELKAKKLHRRAGSATSASTCPNPVPYLTSTQIRTTSSHPNLLTLNRDDVEIRQRSKSSSLLTHGCAPQQSVSLPSSPVTRTPTSASPATSTGPSPITSTDPSPVTSPLQPALATTPPNTTGITLQVTHFPNTTSDHSHQNSTLNGNTSLTSTYDSVPSPDSTSITNTAVPTPPTYSTKSPPIQIPSSNLTPADNPISISPINPLSGSPVCQDLTATTATTGSDDTISEISQHDTGSVVEGEGEDWDVDWLLEDGEERKEDDTVLYTEIEGRIDLHCGLSQFVQFLSTSKQDFTGRYMDRVLHDDVGPCLRLRAHEDRAYRKLLEAVWNNRIFIEHLPTPVREVCAGCGAEPMCHWRVRIGSSHEFKNMGDMCRERIVRACDFYMYLRNLRQGLVKKTLPNIYKEFLRLRLMMNFARLCAG